MPDTQPPRPRGSAPGSVRHRHPAREPRAGHPHPLLALLALEGLKARFFLPRVLPMMAVVSAVLAFSGGGTRSAWIGALVLFGASYAMAPAMRSLPDKLDGSLAFLTSLPVAPTWLAAAHVATCAGYAVAAAAPLSLAAGLYASTLPEGSFGFPSWVGFMVAVVLCVTSASALISGVVIRTRMETLAWLPAAALASLVAAGAGLHRVWPEAERGALAWLLQPASRPLLAWGGTLLALAGVWVAFLLLRAGYERWEPTAPGPEGWAP